MERENEVCYIRGVCGECLNGKLYMHSLDFNGILEYDLTSNEKRIFTGRNTVKDYDQMLSTTSVLYGESIYFINRLADSILKFSIKTKEKTEIYAAGGGNEFSPDIIGEQLLLMPYYYADKIPCVDLKTDQVSYIPFSAPAYIKELIIAHSDWHFFRDIILNGCIYRVCCFGPYINIFNPNTSTGQFVKICGIDDKLQDWTYDGEYFWFICRESSQIIKWKESENRILKTIDLQTYLSEPVIALIIKFIRGKLYVLLHNDVRIIELNELNDSIHVYDPREISGFQGSGVQSFSEYICKDERNIIYFLPCNANGILAIDNEGAMRLLKTDVLTQDILTLFEGMQINERMCSIGSFLDVISSRTKRMLPEKENIGTHIWQYLVQEM